jgi:hypothetical protein
MANEPTTELYFEAHVTIEPVFGERLELFKTICRAHLFRPAELLMKKRQADTAKRSRYDTFCTARSGSYADIVERTTCVVGLLRKAGFTVWRFKIENTLIDVRCKPEEQL